MVAAAAAAGGTLPPLTALAPVGTGGSLSSGSGGGGFSGLGSGGGLSGLKQITRELASSLRGPGGEGSVPGASSGSGSGGFALGGGGGGGGPAGALFKPGGLNFSMQQTAARTREGLAKMAGILPSKLGGGGGEG